MALSASNMLSGGVSLATNQASTILVNAGNSLTTGKNANIDVSSFFISNNLNDSVTIGKNVLESMSYGSNAVRTGLGSLDSMVSMLTSMINTVNQSGNLAGNPTALDSLNTILAGNLTTLNQQITNTNFNGTPLFTGTLGGNSSLTAKYNTTPVNVRTAATTNGAFKGQGAASTTSINVATIGNVTNGDKINIGDITFTMVSGVPDNSGTQVQIVQTSATQTASNIATAIINSSSNSLKGYDVSVSGAKVTLTQRSISSNNIGVQFVPATANIGITTSVAAVPFTGQLYFSANPAAGESVTLTASDGTVVTFTANAGAGTNIQFNQNVNLATTLSNLETQIINHPKFASSVLNGSLVVSGNGTNGVTVSSSWNTDLVTSTGAATSPIVLPSAAPTALASTITLANAIPVAGDTVTVGGVTFSFEANLGANTANTGTAIIGINVATSAANLLTAIQQHPTTSALITSGNLSVSYNGAGVVSVYQTSANNIPTATFTTAANGVVALQGAGTGYIGYTIVPTNAVAAGDLITIQLPNGGNVQFAAANAIVNNQTQYLSGGGNAAGAAASIYNVLLANPTTAGLIQSGQLVVTYDKNATVSIYQNYTGAPTISANGAVAALNPTTITANNPKPLVGGLDLSGIRNINGFIGEGINATVIVSSYANSSTGVNNAVDLLTNNGYASVVQGVVAAATNVSAILSINIAGRTFTGGVFKADQSGTATAANSLNADTFVFTDKSTGEYFTVNSLFFNPDMTTQSNTQANLGNAIQNLLNNSTFAQTRDLAISNISGNVIVNGGAVASMTGMTAELNTTNFNNLQFTNFQISGANNGDLTFKATINNTVYTSATVTNANIPTLLVQGYALALTSSTGDILTLNLGQLGLTQLQNQPTYYQPVATAILNALTNAGSGLNVRTGVSFSDVLTVKMPNVTLNQIMVDNNGNYVPSFDVTNPAGQAAASAVLTNALATVRNAQVALKSSSDAIDQATDALQNLIQITEEAANSFIDTDLIATAEEFSDALKSLSSAILVLKGGSTIASQAQQVIANVVNG